MNNAAAVRKQLTSFGEVLVAQPVPRLQTDATYGIRPAEHLTQLENGATVTAEMTGTGYEFKFATGTNAAAYGRFKTVRVLRYRAGQGSLFRFTGRFPSCAAQSVQKIGPGNNNCQLGFGYRNTEFGIWYVNGGFVEIQTLTVTSAAVGNQNVTITLNGTPTVVAVTTGTIAHVVAQIAAATYTGWEVYGVDATVKFIAARPGVRAGVFSYASTGAVAASFVETVAGVAPTENFVPQAEWNIDRMDGTHSRSGITLDPAKGNVFEIQQQYLGYGALLFSVENPGLGVFQNVHRIEYANNNVSPNMTSPTMRMEAIVENRGNTTSLACYSASMAGFIEGEVVPQKDLVGKGNSKSGITGSVLTNIISFRVGRVFASRVNRSPVWPHLVSFAADGNKTVDCLVVIGATLGGEAQWAALDATNSTVEFDTAGTTVTGGRTVASFRIGKTDSLTTEIGGNQRIEVAAGEVITLAMRTAGLADVAASLTWEEE